MIRARMAVLRWSLLTARRRAGNRLWDAIGRAAGFCMADTWSQERASYGRQMRHWRCGKLRRLHAAGDPWHRFGDHKWRDGGLPIHDRVPTDVGAGILPRWLRGHHYPVGTRRRDRLALRVAFERLQASGQARAERTESLPEALRGVTFREALSAAEQVSSKLARQVWPRRSDHDPDRHDWHMHGPRPGQDPKHWDEHGRLRP